MAKEKQHGLRKIMAEIHGWIGLLASWLLFLSFMAGGISLFNEEVTIWAKPELPQITKQLSKQEIVSSAVAYLQRHTKDARVWHIDLPDRERNPYLEIIWDDSEGNKHFTTISPQHADQDIKPRETEGGHFFLEFHSSLYYLPHEIGIWLMGFAAAVGLVAVISGVIVHKKIFVEFFTFREGKNLRSWLDAHNMFSVFPLPFYMMILYSGLIYWAFTIMPYGSNVILSEEFDNAIYAYPEPEKDGGPYSPMPEIYPLLNRTQADLGKNGGFWLSINHPNKAHSALFVEVIGEKAIDTSIYSRMYRLAGGVMINEKKDARSMEYLRNSVVGLHTARFSDYPLRWLYFLCSMLGCGMMATGTVMWIIKRQKRKNAPLRGIWWMERLNIAVYAGFPLACSVFFYANRLLPASMPGRKEWEIHALFIVWGLVVLYAFGRTDTVRKWRSLFYATAVLFTVVPLLDVYVGRPFWRSLQTGDTMYLSMEAACLMAGALFWLIGRKVKVEKAVT